MKADVARLTRGVLGARLRRDRDCFLTFFVGMVLFGSAAALDFFAQHRVAAPFPVLFLAGRSTVARVATSAARRRMRDGSCACGTLGQDHLAKSRRALPPREFVEVGAALAPENVWSTRGPGASAEPKALRDLVTLFFLHQHSHTSGPLSRDLLQTTLR